MCKEEALLYVVLHVQVWALRARVCICVSEWLCVCVCAHRERERGNDQKAAALVHDKGKRPTETQRDIAAHSGGAREPDVGEFNTLEPYSLKPPHRPPFPN